MNESWTAVQIILGMIPFVLALAGFFTYIIVRSWKQQIHQLLHDIGLELRQLRSESITLRTMAHGFSSDDPEPFGSKVGFHNEQLVGLERTLSHLQQKYVDFQEHIRYLENLPFSNVLWSPFQWHKLRDDVLKTTQEIPTFRDAAAAITRSAAQLKNISWEIALKCQSILASIQKNKNDIHLFSETFIEDSLLDQASVRIDEWESTLHTSLPAVFFSPDRNIVLEQADKENTARVYRIILNADSEVGKISSLLGRWYNRWLVLADLIPELEDELQSIHSKMIMASENKLCPLTWYETASHVKHLQEEHSQISPLEKPRSISQVEQNARTLEGIRDGVWQLNNTVDQVINSRDKLINLWSSMTLMQGADWTKRTLGFCDEMNQFHPGNFGHELPPDQLRDELLKLAALHKNHPQGKIMAGLNESEVPSLLQSSTKLMNTHEILYPKVALLQDRFRELQKNVQLSLEKIQQCSVLINQLISLMKTNPFLQKIAGKEADRYLQDLNRAKDDLKQSQNGIVGKKMENTNNLVEKMTNQANRWYKAFEDDLLNRKTQIAEDARILNDSVCLDEPALGDIDRLIKTEISESIRAIQPRGVNYPLMEVVKQIRELNNDWQRCVAAENALKEIAGAVLERYRKAEKSRQVALQKYEKVDNLLPESPIWPPSTQNINRERQKISELEKQWQAIKHEKNRALSLVGRLSDISEQYQGLSVLLTSALEKIQTEHKRIEQYEQRLKESKLLWQRQVTNRQENKILLNSVREFLEEIDRDYEMIKVRYSKGSLIYNQVLQNIRGLCRKIDDALMPIDQVQVIDINGVVQKRLF